MNMTLLMAVAEAVRLDASQGAILHRSHRKHWELHGLFHNTQGRTIMREVSFVPWVGSLSRLPDDTHNGMYYIPALKGVEDPGLALGIIASHMGVGVTTKKVRKNSMNEPICTNEFGTKYWRRDGQLHREDGPAIEYDNGTKYWYLNGKRHREDGPAVEYDNGSKEWWLNGKLHRIDGPAIELANGDKEWHLNGKRHRIDGPAVEWIGVAKHWYLNGEELTVEEFNERITQTNKKIKSHF